MVAFSLFVGVSPRVVSDIPMYRVIQLKCHHKEKNLIKKRAIETQLAAIERGDKYTFLQAV